MVQAYANFWRQYFDFGGKTDRPGYWWVVLCHLLVGIAISILAVVISQKLLVLDTIYGLASLIPGIAIVIRRLRDAGRHPALILTALIPIVGWIILLVLLVGPSKN